METIIPQLRAQIAKLQKERDHNIARMQRLAGLGVSIESALTQAGDSPEVSAFVAGIKEIKAELG
jgi:hypothetical protein